MSIINNNFDNGLIQPKNYKVMNDLKFNKDPDVNNTYFNYFKQNQLTEAKKFKYDNNISLYAIDEKGNTLLHYLLDYAGTKKVTEQEMINTLDNIEDIYKLVNIKNNNKQTALHLICKYQLNEIYEHIVKKNIQINYNIKDVYGKTPIFYAATGSKLNQSLFHYFNVELLNIYKNEVKNEEKQLTDQLEKDNIILDNNDTNFISEENTEIIQNIFNMKNTMDDYFNIKQNVHPLPAFAPAPAPITLSKDYNILNELYYPSTETIDKNSSMFNEHKKFFDELPQSKDSIFNTLPDGTPPVCPNYYEDDKGTCTSKYMIKNNCIKITNFNYGNIPFEKILLSKLYDSEYKEWFPSVYMMLYDKFFSNKELNNYENFIKLSEEYKKKLHNLSEKDLNSFMNYTDMLYKHHLLMLDLKVKRKLVPLVKLQKLIYILQMALALLSHYTSTGHINNIKVIIIILLINTILKEEDTTKEYSFKKIINDINKDIYYNNKYEELIKEIENFEIDKHIYIDLIQKCWNSKYINDFDVQDNKLNNIYLFDRVQPMFKMDLKNNIINMDDNCDIDFIYNMFMYNYINVLCDFDLKGNIVLTDKILYYTLFSNKNNVKQYVINILSYQIDHTTTEIDKVEYINVQNTDNLPTGGINPPRIVNGSLLYNYIINYINKQTNNYIMADTNKFIILIKHLINYCMNLYIHNINNINNSSINKHQLINNNINIYVYYNLLNIYTILFINLIKDKSIKLNSFEFNDHSKIYDIHNISNIANEFKNTNKLMNNIIILYIFICFVSIYCDKINKLPSPKTLDDLAWDKDVTYKNFICILCIFLILSISNTDEYLQFFNKYYYFKNIKQYVDYTIVTTDNDLINKIKDNIKEIYPILCSLTTINIPSVYNLKEIKETLLNIYKIHAGIENPSTYLYTNTLTEDNIKKDIINIDKFNNILTQLNCINLYPQIEFNVNKFNKKYNIYQEFFEIIINLKNEKDLFIKNKKIKLLQQKNKFYNNHLIKMNLYRNNINTIYNDKYTKDDIYNITNTINESCLSIINVLEELYKYLDPHTRARYVRFNIFHNFINTSKDYIKLMNNLMRIIYKVYNSNTSLNNMLLNTFLHIITSLDIIFFNKIALKYPKAFVQYILFTQLIIKRNDLNKQKYNTLYINLMNVILSYYVSTDKNKCYIYFNSNNGDNINLNFSFEDPGGVQNIKFISKTKPRNNIKKYIDEIYANAHPINLDQNIHIIKCLGIYYIFLDYLIKNINIFNNNIIKDKDNFNKFIYSLYDQFYEILYYNSQTLYENNINNICNYVFKPLMKSINNIYVLINSIKKDIIDQRDNWTEIKNIEVLNIKLDEKYEEKNKPIFSNKFVFLTKSIVIISPKQLYTNDLLISFNNIYSKQYNNFLKWYNIINVKKDIYDINVKYIQIETKLKPQINELLTNNSLMIQLNDYNNNINKKSINDKHNTVNSIITKCILYFNNPEQKTLEITSIESDNMFLIKNLPQIGDVLCRFIGDANKHMILYFKNVYLDIDTNNYYYYNKRLFKNIYNNTIIQNNDKDLYNKTINDYIKNNLLNYIKWDDTKKEFVCKKKVINLYKSSNNTLFNKDDLKNFNIKQLVLYNAFCVPICYYKEYDNNKNIKEYIDKITNEPLSIY